MVDTIAHVCIALTWKCAFFNDMAQYQQDHRANEVVYECESVNTVVPLINVDKK